MYLFEIQDILFAIKSIKTLSSHFDITNYIVFSSANTRSGASNKLIFLITKIIYLNIHIFTDYHYCGILCQSENRVGPRTVTWGTPDKTEQLGEETPSKTTHCVLPLKNEEIQFLQNHECHTILICTISVCVALYQMPWQSL